MAQQDLQLRNGIQRLSLAVNAVVGGDLKPLAAQPEDNKSPDDDFGALLTSLERLFGQFDTDFIRISSEADASNNDAVQLGDLSQSIKDGAQPNANQTNEVLSRSEVLCDNILSVFNGIEHNGQVITGISSSASKASGIAAQVF